jgi:two-component system alkaline phosphatase synthesis response regulator PhoP
MDGVSNGFALRERPRSGIVCGQSTLGGRMARAVLIVDDEQHIRLLIEQTLEELLDEDVELYTAADGDEALAAIAAQRPALVFLDVMMPGRSGLDVCRAVRADPELAGAHIVLLTAKGQAQDRAEGLAAGADEFLTKPFDPDALLALARGVLGLA